jgi:hypothetical protein
MATPRFLKSLASSAPKRSLDKSASCYRPLLGIWLIDLALMFDWCRPGRAGRWPEIECQSKGAAPGRIGFGRG